MLRRSNRKRSVPAGRRDAIAASAKRTLCNPHSTVGSSTSTAISGSAEIIYSRIGMPASFVRSISLPTVTPSVHVSTIVTRNQANQQMSTVTSPSLGTQLAPVNLKQKIIAGEYIDLTLLLINSQASLSDKHTVIVSHGELLIEPKQQHKQIVNIETWTDAFLIFTSIYCNAHPLKFQDLLRYIHCIRLVSKRCSGGWKAYDKQFRVRMTQDPSSSWAVIDPELWLIYMKNLPSAYGNNFSTNQNRTYKCYNFNYSDNCTNHACAFSQSCLRCYGQHPLIQCKQQHFLPNRSGGAPRLRHPHIRPRFQSPVLNNSVQYPPRQNTQVTASGQPSYNYY